MTTDNQSSSTAPDQDYLSFNPADMTGMRVIPADLARLFNVTRNTVSQWIKKGIVTLGPDGRIDPVRAAKEVLRRGDPKLLRARVFKAAISDITSALRREIEEAEQGRAGALAELALCREWREHALCTISRLRDLLIEHEWQLRTAANAEEFRLLAERLYEQAEDECFDQVAANCE